MDVLKHTKLLMASIRAAQGRIGTILLSTLALSMGESVAQSDGVPVRDRTRLFQKTVQNWKAIRHKNIVMQQREYTCGAAVLATMIRYYWKEDVSEYMLLQDLDEMMSQEDIADRLVNGLTITDLRQLAVKNGFLATIGRLSFKQLTESKIPLIVALKTNEYMHFVIFRGFDNPWVYLADPARGNIRVPAAQFTQEWQKNTVLVVIKKGGQPDPSSPLHADDREFLVGDTSWQHIRALPSKAFFNPGVPLNSAR